jgi:hypothetical protein
MGRGERWVERTSCQFFWCLWEVVAGVWARVWLGEVVLGWLDWRLEEEARGEGEELPLLGLMMLMAVAVADDDEEAALKGLLGS